MHARPHHPHPQITQKRTPAIAPLAPDPRRSSAHQRAACRQAEAAEARWFALLCARRTWTVAFSRLVGERAGRSQAWCTGPDEISN